MRRRTEAHCAARTVDWLDFVRRISRAGAEEIELIRERGADVRIARATAPDGSPVVVKLWNRPGWRGRLRRLSRGNPAGREWRSLCRLRALGLDVPEPIAYLPDLGGATAHTEALVTRDIGRCQDAVSHLKALISAGDRLAEHAFVERIVGATGLMLRHGYIDIDHRLPNFIVGPAGVPVRLDFELIARRPWPRAWTRAYGQMLGTLVGSFVFAVQPDQARVRHFARHLRATLTPPDSVLAAAERRVREMLATQRRGNGMRVEIENLWA